MAHALPLTKLASLLVKTLAKPLSKRIKHDFSRFNFTKQMLIDIGQTSHTVTSRMQIWSAGYRVRSIKPLDQEKALKNGAELVGESFIFLVSGGLVVWEYNRSQESARDKKAKELAKQKAENAALQAKLHTLDLRLKAVEDVVKLNSQSILSLGGTKYIEPAADQLVPIDDDESESEDSQASPVPVRKQPPAPTDKSITGKKSWWKLW